MALSHTKILEAAREVMTERGVAELSMRRLAQELDVAPGALYYHVDSKQQLLIDLADFILEKAPSELSVAAGTRDRQRIAQSLLQRGDVLYSVLYPIREGSQVMRLALNLHKDPIAPTAAIAQDLLVLGFSDEQAMMRARLLTHLSLDLIEEQQNRVMFAEVIEGPLDPTDAGRAAYLTSLREAIEMTLQH